MNTRLPRFLTPVERAEAITKANYHAVKGKVLRITNSRLSGGHIDLDEKDVEAAYNEAWTAIAIKITDGEQIDNLTGYLVDITHKRALDIYRQRKEAMHSDEAVDDRPAHGDLTEDADDRGRLSDLFERLRDRLNVNERKAVALCILHGYSRADAAKAMKMPEPVFQRVMDSAWKKVTAVATGLQARGCGDDEWARALRAYALGLIDENHRDYSRVADHIEGCALCARYVAGLRGLAAVLPPIGVPLLPFAHHGLFRSAIRSLRRLLGGHGTSSTAAGATAGGSTAGGAAAGAGAVKVAAVIAGLAIAGATVKIATDHPTRRHTHDPKPAPSAVQLPPPVSALASPIPSAVTPTRTRRRAAHRQSTHTSRPASLATVSPDDFRTIREFGMEHPRTTTTITRPTTRTPVPAKAISAAPASRTSARESQESNSGGHGEFTFEKK